MERRRIIETNHEYFSTYNRYGTVSSNLKWLPLSKDEKLEHEVFIVQFEPESSSSLHKHKGYEEFYVIDGESYSGEWKDGKYDGYGTYTLADGRKGVGEFRNDKPWNITNYDSFGHVTGNWIEGEKK